MKTFSTSGTGSQQTLSEIESDKIPIYDSLTDAEADLANLEEGQVIGTKDEGSELSAPVDTVQSGNMHAVTSNAVAESLSYSTTEQLTGGKWLDGKDVYKCTLEIPLNNESSKQVDLSSLNISKIMKYEGVFHHTSWDYFYPVPITTTDGQHAIDWQYNAGNTKSIIINTKSTVSLWAGVLYLYIFYTKTTD